MTLPDDLGASMRAAVDSAPTPAFDLGRTRQVRRRQSAARAAFVVAAVAIVAVGASAATAFVRHDRTQDLASASTCPASRGDAAARPGAADVMLSPGPRRLVVCHYGSIVDPAPEGGDVSMDDKTGRRIVDALNALEPVPAGVTFECQFDGGERFDVVAEYADGHVEVVSVRRGGCQYASNGTRLTHEAPGELFRDLYATSGASPS